VTNGVALLAKWHQNKYIYTTQGLVADSFEGNFVFMKDGSRSAHRKVPAVALAMSIPA
jgi:hypothetical protein